MIKERLNNFKIFYLNVIRLFDTFEEQMFYRMETMI